jgi:methylphosphotriester-DNA--protein-cysteine methyltransferase
MRRTWTLLGKDGKPFQSLQPGTLGAHRGTRIFGRLDCRAALRAIERGGYVRYRVFFLNRAHARAAGYRPCAVCLPKEYAAWKSTGRR